MQTSFSHARIQRAKNGLSDPTFLPSRVWRGIFFLPDPAMACFRRYVNFFLSRKGLTQEKWTLGPGLSFFPGLMQEKWALGPDFSHFSGLAHGKWALGPVLSSCPGPALENQSLGPDFFSSQPRSKLIFHHYVPLRATHYNVPNEYPCVCAASIRSPSTAAFVADSACSR